MPTALRMRNFETLVPHDSLMSVLKVYEFLFLFLFSSEGPQGEGWDPFSDRLHAPGLVLKFFEG